MHAPVLKYFDTVVRLGSIRKAADQLNVASSAINRQLLKLEDMIGIPLFERLPRGVRLTPAGEILIRHVRTTLREFDLARADIEDLKGLRKGTVAIGATEGVAAEYLPGVLTQFNKRHPGISFTVNVLAGDALIDALRGNEVDIGFIFNPPEKAGVAAGASVPLRIGAVMRSSHPLAKHRRLKLAQCQPYPVILPDMQFPNRAWLDSAMADSSLQFQIAVCTNSFQLMRELAREGMGIAFQTTIGIEDELRRGELVHLPLRDTAIKPSVFAALVRAKQQLHLAAAMFLEGIRRSFDAMSRPRTANRH